MYSKKARIVSPATAERYSASDTLPSRSVSIALKIVARRASRFAPAPAASIARSSLSYCAVLMLAPSSPIPFAHSSRVRKPSATPCASMYAKKAFIVSFPTAERYSAMSTVPEPSTSIESKTSTSSAPLAPPPAAATATAFAAAFAVSAAASSASAAWRSQRTIAPCASTAAATSASAAAPQQPRR